MVEIDRLCADVTGARLAYSMGTEVCTMPSNPSIAERGMFGRRIIVDDDDRDSGVNEVVVTSSSTWQSTMALLGRLMIAAIFLTSGIAKLTDTPGTVEHMVKAGIPYAETLALVAGAAEILGAIALIFGVLTRAGAFGLLLYMLPTTLIFHAFWNFEGAERMPQMVNFMKNLAIMGGLAIAAAFGAGRISIDRAVRRSRVP